MTQFFDTRKYPQLVWFGIAAIVVALVALPFALAGVGTAGVRILNSAILYTFLALGLNIVVGFAGLLDLGYIAFYAVGAYTYALLASPHFDVHLPFWIVLPIGAGVACLFGVLLGAPTLKLRGDYLAIVTLGFGEIIRIFLNNLARPVNITNGPQGITLIDPFRIGDLDFRFGDTLAGLSFSGPIKYYYFLVLVLVAVIIVNLRLQNSRLGRAWEAIREDEVAARAMGINTTHVKLLAFAMGAAIAGLTGSIFAAVQTGVFPQNFEVTLLIMIYAALILGGAGSISGAVLGAIVVAAVPEILRTPENARWLFYCALVLALVVAVRPWQRLAIVAGAVVGFGLVVHSLVAWLWPVGVEGEPAGGTLAGLLDSWVVIPAENQDTLGNAAFVLLVAAVLWLTLLKGTERIVVLVPTIYLAAFVWENRLVEQPSVTRQLLFGAILVAMMTTRPQGLLGTPRVENPI
jgi:branched-chain amino acid transport system permease protein